jgi:hypothetical protein
MDNNIHGEDLIQDSSHRNEECSTKTVTCEQNLTSETNPESQIAHEDDDKQQIYVEFVDDGYANVVPHLYPYSQDKDPNHFPRLNPLPGGRICISDYPEYAGSRFITTRTALLKLGFRKEQLVFK